MAKQRKTKAQKIVSDERRSHEHVIQSTMTFSLPPSYETKVKSSLTTPVPTQYKDLQKTLLVSAFITAFQLILFFLLKTHSITVPSVQY